MKTFSLKGSSHWSGLRSGQRAAALCGVFFLTIGLLFTGCPSPTDPPKKPPVVPGTVDKTALEAAIAEAVENIESVLVAEDASEVPDTAEWVIQADKDAYQDAIGAANAVNASETATQAQVDAAKLALDGATATFDEAKQAGEAVVDKTELEEAITDAGTAIEAVTVSVDGSDVSPTEQWVTAEVKATYQAAIETATGIFNASTATQDQVNSAVDDLATATTAFTNAKQAGTALSISGTLTGGRHWGIVKIWDNETATGDPIKTVTLKNETAWQVAIAIPASATTLYATVEDDIYGGESDPVEIQIGNTDVTGVELNFPVTIPDGKNAALRYKTATGNVVLPASNVLNALDGKNNTQWEMGNTTDFAELELDFGFPVTANAIAIRSFSNYFTSVTVSYKANAQASDWTQVAAHSSSSVSGSTNGSTAWPLWFGSTVTGTQFKLRVTISTSSQVRNPGMYEFELYNAGFDRDDLADAIEEAEETLEDTVTADNGSALPYTVYWATAAAKTAYQSAIDAAIAVFKNPAITVQDTIDTAVTNLATATTALGRAAGELPTDTRALLAAIAKANILKDFPWVSTNSGSTGKDVSYAADPQSAQSWERALYPNQKWVTEANRTTYTNAISAAGTVASTSTAQADVDAALGTLNAATGTYTGAFGAGSGAAIGANANIALRYQKVTASNRHNSAGFGGESAVDGSITNNKRWATSSQNSVPAYLELDFGSAVTIAKGEIVAYASTAGANAGRISAFSVDYYDDAEEEWVSVYTKPGTAAIGGDIAGSETNKFSFNLDQNTTAQKFRLYITASNPLDFSIWEFRLITPNS